jgi:DNA-binding Lrp family transcriptional regulator
MPNTLAERDAPDRIDLKILRCLQEDGRMSNLKLAAVARAAPDPRWLHPGL